MGVLLLLLAVVAGCDDWASCCPKKAWQRLPRVPSWLLLRRCGVGSTVLRSAAQGLRSAVCGLR